MKQPCVCLELEIQTRCTASRPETLDDNQEESLGILSAGLNVRTHFFSKKTCVCLFFSSVRAQAKTSHFHILKAAVFSEGAAPSAEHHPGRFMKVHELYRSRDHFFSHTNKILEKERGNLEWCCLNLHFFLSANCLLNHVHHYIFTPLINFLCNSIPFFLMLRLSDVSVLEMKHIV